MKEEEYTSDGEIYKKTFDKKEENPSKVITIAGRRIEIYIYTILQKLQKFDQIELCCLDRYSDRAIEIIHLLEAVGVAPEKGKLIFEKAEEDILNRDTGKMYSKPVNRIELTKIPELFRFNKTYG